METNTPKEGDTRDFYLHEIMTKGGFKFTTKEGEDIEVYGQQHILAEITQEFDGEDWIEVDREGEEDYFYLSDYEDGYRFEEEKLCELYDVEYTDYDWNGYGCDWCGIEDTDTKEQALEKWEAYKNKFPLLTSKDQFEEC
jgi:hypothetical protein